MISTCRCSTATTSPTRPARVFVHTAPSHGRDDFDIWMASNRVLRERGIDTRIPYTVDADGFLTADAPGFEGRRVIDDKGNKGDANDAIIKALIESGNLVARGRLKHQYPHSWRSKKPLIFRNTPQWFIALDQPFLLPLAGEGGPTQSGRMRGDEAGSDAPAPRDAPSSDPASRGHLLPQAGEGRAAANQPTLRAVALEEIARTRWVPEAGENRINGMIANRPDWVVSRQRAWGVPIAIFVDAESQAAGRCGGQRAHPGCLRERGRRRLVRGGRARTLPGAARQRRMEKGRRRARRLVRLGLDARLHDGRSRAIPRPRRHYARARRARPGHVPRRLGPAPRLVPFLVARGQRHARPRALRCRADARVRARRARAQDGEIRRQCRCAANRHQGFRRRHSAPVGRRVRLFRRPAYRAGNPQDLRRNLQEAAQHDPLDARRARPLRRAAAGGP